MRGLRRRAVYAVCAKNQAVIDNGVGGASSEIAWRWFASNGAKAKATVLEALGSIAPLEV